MRKLTLLMVAIAATVALSATAAFAYTLNADGTGFVGKGEVQTAFGWNNKVVQTNAGGVDFQVEMVTENSWVCTKDGAKNTQERENVRTTAALIDSVTRDNKKQVTGFTLSGYQRDADGNVVETVINRDGPALGTCPTGWTAGPIESEVISSDLYATFGTQRVLLP